MSSGAALAGLARIGVERVAPGVYQLHHRARNVLNCFYVASPTGRGVLVDAGTVLCGGRLGAQVEALESALKAEAAEDSAAADATSDAAPPRLGLHVLTHAHPDHNGASQLMCTRFGVPFWVGEADADVAEGKERMKLGPTWSPLHALPHNLWSGASHPVDRRMRCGDAILDTGFMAVACPGHTAGHVALWRASDGVLLCGDAVANFRMPSAANKGGGGGWPGFSLPPLLFNTDQRQVKASLALLASLRPRVMGFGHGQSFTNDDGEFERYVRTLR